MRPGVLRCPAQRPHPDPDQPTAQPRRTSGPHRRSGTDHPVGDSRYLAGLATAGQHPQSVKLIVSVDSPDWLQITAGDWPDDRDVQPDDKAWLIFTSGSTGTPKGVLHSHRSLTAGVWGSVEGRSVRTADVYLFPFPMCHIAGYNVLVRHATQSTVVLSAHFRPEEFVEVVNRFQVASCSLAPTMLHALLPYVDDTGACMPTRGEIAYGSAAMPADLMDRAISRLAVDFHQGYGMTETAGNVTFLRPDDHRLGIISDSSVIRTAGRPESVGTRRPFWVDSAA